MRAYIRRYSTLMKVKRSRVLLAVVVIAIVLVAGGFYLYAIGSSSVPKPSRTVTFPGWSWKVQIFRDPHFAFLYETSKDAQDGAVTYSVKGNEIIATTELYGSSTKFTLYTKTKDETPVQALKRLFIDTLDDSYKKVHCVAVAQPVVVSASDGYVGFTDPRKSGWVITPDALYEKKLIAEYGGDMPDPPCGPGGIDYNAASYYEFHTDSPTVFVRTGFYQDGPFFDQQSLRF